MFGLRSVRSREDTVVIAKHDYLLRPFHAGPIRPCTNQAKRLLFGTTLSWQARGEPREPCSKVALRMWLRLSVCNRQALAVLVLSLALIHPSSWNKCSANFAFTQFSEVATVFSCLPYENSVRRCSLC